MPLFLSLLFCTQSDRLAGELPSEAVPSQSHSVREGVWLKAGSEKDLGCPNLVGQEQRKGCMRNEGEVAGRRKEALRG